MDRLLAILTLLRGLEESGDNGLLLFSSKKFRRGNGEAILFGESIRSRLVGVLVLSTLAAVKSIISIL